MMEPVPPRPGEPLRASWAQRLVAYVRSLRVTAGPGLLARRTPAGTVVSLAPPARAPRPANPRLFEVRVGGDPGTSGSDGNVLVFLPCDGDWSAFADGGAYVSVGGVPAYPDEDAGQDLGGPDAPWVSLGRAPVGGWRVWLSLRTLAEGFWCWRLTLREPYDPPPAAEGLDGHEPIPPVLVAERPRKLRLQTRAPAIRQIRAGHIALPAPPDSVMARLGHSYGTTQTVDVSGGAITLRGAAAPGSADNQLDPGEPVAGWPVLGQYTDDADHAAYKLLWLSLVDFQSRAGISDLAGRIAALERRLAALES